ncbi:hypothetical protein V1517DRAFT_74338 [Lipomyces orientalis]|uniref:Uncharacterized protein n=1 Tax=Lipomyces orientalis TaxID=1233043 RepID=A0ACC3TVF6_9ASCO
MMADPLPSYSSHAPQASGGPVLPLQRSREPTLIAGSAAQADRHYSMPPPPPEPLQPSPQLPFQLQHHSHHACVTQQPLQPAVRYNSTSPGSSAFSTAPSSYSFASAAASTNGYSSRDSPSYAGSSLHSQSVSLAPLRMHLQSGSPTQQHDKPLSGPVQSYYSPPPPPQQQQQQQHQQHQHQHRNQQPAPSQVTAAAAAVALHQHAHSSQVAAAQVAATIADVTAHKPAREIKRRTKTGCLTCRKRRIKCDERHPICFNCAKSKRVCLGYDPVFKAQRGDKHDEKESSKSEGETSQQSQDEVKRIKIDSLLAE